MRNDYVVARDFDEVAQVERIGWSFLPCIRTVRGRSIKEDLLPGAGMSEPQHEGTSACGLTKVVYQ